ncbi:Minf_1886 family protein [Bremerella cremea]|uniref:Minf_1886 family protein n=1 Tax=Bremerella cremea TaxID=1031537 RepID=UPI0031E7474C
MSEDTYSAFMQLLKDDPRYRMEAYQFVREALSFGQRFHEEQIELDEEEEEDLDLECFDEDEDDFDEELESWDEDEDVERHLTGQILCQAIRTYALQQYGLLAKVVLNSWGLHTTGDFGEIVYNLIGIGMMRKSKSDRREDFDDQYDFEEAFVNDFEFETSEESGQS